MIAFLEGELVGRGPDVAVLDVGGVGYELSMSSRALAGLPDGPGPVRIWTYLQVKDDGLSLFGFLDPAEKEMFMALLAVKGLGPKLALALLSALAPAQVADAIARGDDAAIARAPGIGKKTAQRVVLELKDRFSSLAAPLVGGGVGVGGGAGGADGVPAAAGAPVSGLQEAREALRGMGFSDAEADAALSGCPADAGVEEGIRYALKSLGAAR